ncbi:Ankyrin repeat domain-containing protein 54 [Desmophyllum pertusum]|uniref:Ankyrin repeat domain-containing protein 54 n=1 Tax=Desmophyllum pertusum TaxID=174260 RepID=A0A9W9ZNF5_9CNID|nr:Ankyrin repeat domain-containing protein 54 [Desmophyllum pertusum]
MAEGDQDGKNPTSFTINWSSSNLSSDLSSDLLMNTAIPSTVGHSYSQQSHQTSLEHGRQFSMKVLPSRFRLRARASTKCSPLGHDYLAEKKLRDAVHHSNTDNLFELINQGVNVCSADSKRRTALHFAAAQGNDHTLRILLENGANPNAKDLNGNTPLHLAACTNQLKIVTLLLQAGSDVNAADFSGKTPLDLAYSRLRVLHGDVNIREKPSIYCEEVKQVIDMIKAYMSRLGIQRQRKRWINFVACLVILPLRKRLMKFIPYWPALLQ